jgi:hypothetical protein
VNAERCGEVGHVVTSSVLLDKDYNLVIVQSALTLA